MIKENVFIELKNLLFKIPKKYYFDQTNILINKNALIYGFPENTATSTHYLGTNYLNHTAIANFGMPKRLDLDSTLYAEMDKLIALTSKLIEMEIIINGYLTRALNISEVRKDIDLLLPWANLQVLALPMIGPKLISRFLKENKEFEHMAKERLLMNLLMK